MYQATRTIYNALKEKFGDDLKVFMEEHGEASDVSLGFPLKNGGNYKIRFISTDDDNDVAVRIVSLLRIDESKRTEVLEVLNKLNCRFRYAKFCCDKDNDINVEYDFTVNGNNPAESAPEILARFMRIIEEAYPEIMRAMWA